MHALQDCNFATVEYYTFQVPILRHFQGRLRLEFSFLPRLTRLFVTNVFLQGQVISLPSNPKLEDQSASLSLGHHLRPVRQGRPYQ
jgi:hypothetical protein